MLKDGEIVFAVEEERLSRAKYDGGSYASIVKILDYTDKLDYLIVAHTQPLANSPNRVDFTGDDVYTGLCRKLGLIDNGPNVNVYNHSSCRFESMTQTLMRHVHFTEADLKLLPEPL